MKKILIIEDDPIVGKIYQNHLGKNGFEVHLSRDGQQGFFQICESKPDAVLLDLMLPRMSGLEVLKKIRAVREFEEVPIFVFTNAYVTTMIRDATAAGATSVFNKASATPYQVIDMLNKAFEQMAAASARAAKNGADGNAHTTDGNHASNEMYTAFVTSGRARIAELRKILAELLKTADNAKRHQQLEVLSQKLGAHATNAGVIGLTCTAKLGLATQALINELLEGPKALTPSAFKTTAQALDCLFDLTVGQVPPDLADNPPINVLVVDDEMLARRAIVMALEKAALNAVAVDSPEAALEKAQGARYDLVFLDINMPGMDGFALCEKLRQTRLNATTPVIFVTSTADFQARAQSTLRGGTDLIAKPFMLMEFTVSALTYAIRTRAEAARRIGGNSALTPQFASTEVIV